MNINIVVLDERCTPVRATDGSAGFDLIARTSNYLDSLHEVVEYKLGVKFEIPKGYVGLIFPRSSISKMDLRLSNCVGVIDSDFRGEVSARFDTRLQRCKDEYGFYNIGDRCCQIVFIKHEDVNFTLVPELSNTVRGEGGYGHTGR